MITYTSIVGGKDTLRVQPESKYPYVAFVDGIDQYIEPWELRKASSIFVSPRRNAKIHKILPHLFLDTKVSLWIDGSVQLKKPPEDFLPFLKNYDIVFMKSGPGCIYDEAENIKKSKYEDDEIVDEQVRYSLKRGIPKHYGTYSPRITLMRHNAKTKEFSERWWAEICRGSSRDMLTLKLAAKDLPVRIGTFDFNEDRDSEFIRIYDHLK